MVFLKKNLHNKYSKIEYSIIQFLLYLLRCEMLPSLLHTAPENPEDPIEIKHKGAHVCIIFHIIIMESITSP